MSERRTPLFSRFIVTGAVVGALIGIVAALLSSRAGNYGTLAAYAYFALGGAFVAGLLAAIVAVVVDGRSARGG